MKKWRWLFSVAMVAAIAGCNPMRSNLPNTGTQADITPSQFTTEAGGVLPPSLAAAPETLNLPRRFQIQHRMRVMAVGPTVRIYSGTPWHGRRVTVYYVPKANVVADRGAYYLRSTANLQRIGQSDIRADGTWTVVWNVGNEHLTPKYGLFLLARSDDGEISLAQVNHLVNHKY